MLELDVSLRVKFAGMIRYDLYEFCLRGLKGGSLILRTNRGLEKGLQVPSRMMSFRLLTFNVKGLRRGFKGAWKGLDGGLEK